MSACAGRPDRRRRAVVIVNGNAYRDVKIETGEIMAKANWKFGPSAVVAKY